jgi:hypothetical protein
MNDGNNSIFSRQVSPPPAFSNAYREKKSYHPKILLIIGVLIVLAVGGIIAWNFAGIPKDELAIILDDSVDRITSLYDSAAMVRDGDIAVRNIFQEGTLEIFSQRIDALDALCDKVCGVWRIQFGSGEENELFSTIRTGLSERKERYRKYFIDNFEVFYRAFAVGFQEVGIKPYSRNEAAGNLLASENAATAELAQIFDDYLSRVSAVTDKMTVLRCGSGANQDECSRLDASRQKYDEAMRNRDLTRRVFFGEYGKESPLSENFLGKAMAGLGQLLQPEEG